eukprot:scaffold204102_cov28-Attheya_sp.AAC.1
MTRSDQVCSNKGEGRQCMEGSVWGTCAERSAVAMGVVRADGVSMGLRLVQFWTHPTKPKSDATDSVPPCRSSDTSSKRRKSLIADFKVLALGGFQEVQGLFPVALWSASDGLEVFANEEWCNFGPFLLALFCSFLVALFEKQVLRESSCPPGRNLWVAIKAVGSGTHVAVLGHGAAL